MIKYLLFFSLLISACSQNQNNTEVKAEVVNNSETKTEAKLPIYRSFDDIEYIFKYENDTTYVINFWATWCKPCVAELPYFEQLNGEMQDKKVKVILVSLDFEKQIESKLLPFIKKHDLQSDVMLLLDDKAVNWIDKVDESWSGAIPATVVYNKEYWEFYEGEFDSYEDINQIVNTYLN
jgi:thiol-disulfide isomerase/thioredoxin